VSTQLCNIEIVDETSLFKACDLLHDARCDLSKVTFDESTKKASLVFEREFFEEASLIKSERRFLTRYSFPLAESVLELCGIPNFEAHDTQGIGIYMFNEIRKNGSVYNLVFCENMSISISFIDQPKGKLNDIRLLPKEGKLFSTWKMFCGNDSSKG
jgi:hypothetical protein